MLMGTLSNQPATTSTNRVCYSPKWSRMSFGVYKRHHSLHIHFDLKATEMFSNQQPTTTTTTTSTNSVCYYAIEVSPKYPRMSSSCACKGHHSLHIHFDLKAAETLSKQQKQQQQQQQQKQQQQQQQTTTTN